MPALATRIKAIWPFKTMVCQRHRRAGRSRIPARRFEHRRALVLLELQQPNWTRPGTGQLLAGRARQEEPHAMARSYEQRTRDEGGRELHDLSQFPRRRG